MEEAFCDAKNVLLCEPMDVGALAATIERLLRDGELRKQLSAGALRLHEEWFSWESSVDRTMAALGLSPA